MLRIMIADDEASARAALRSMKWAAHGCSLVGEAENGQKLLGLLAEKPADIVLLDIGMPVISGLQLLPIIAEKHPSIKVILLTMYREFDYVLKAMRMNVVDYLIKDVFKPEQLFACIERASLMLQENLLAREQEHERTLQANLKNDTDTPLPRIKPVRLFRHHQNGEPADEFYMTRIERRLQSLHGCELCLPVSPSEWLIFGCHDETDLLDGMLEYWGEAFCTTAALDGCCTIADAVKKGRACLEGGFYHPECRLFSAAYECRDMPDALLYQFQKEVRHFFFELDSEADALETWLEQCEKEQVRPADVKRQLISLLSVTLMNHVDPSSQISAVWHADSVRQMIALVRGYLLRARLAGDGKRTEIQRVEAYIRTHLDGDLTVQELSAMAGLSPNYLNRLFTQHTQESLKHYITRLRMETAAHLLKNSDLRINEIARQVGFSSPRYFSNAFSNYYGASPNSYRN